MGRLPVAQAVPLLVDLAVLPRVALMDLLLVAVRLVRLARGLRVALAGLLLVVEPVVPPRRAALARAPRRRRF